MLVTACLALTSFPYDSTDLRKFLPANSWNDQSVANKKNYSNQPITQQTLGTLIRSLPSWLQDYIEFHRQSLQDLSRENWKSRRYLIVRCYFEDQCGGTSDRIKGIPLFLLWAARSNRTLFIRWTRPYPLEEFMLPVTINWTVPGWMSDILDSSDVNDFRRLVRASLLESVTRKTSKEFTILEGMMHSPDGGGNRYENLTGTSRKDYGPDYHYIFRAFFQPTPPIAHILSRFFQETGLKPGQYAVAHQRALYSPDASKYPTLKITAAAINAVNCASQLMPGAPIFFASDSALGSDAVREYARTQNRSIVTRDDLSKQPVHLEFGHPRGVNLSSPPPPSDYYATFVDLWIMGNGRCVAFGPGGFGSWGLIVGYNVSCGYRYFKKPPCRWLDGNHDTRQ